MDYKIALLAAGSADPEWLGTAGDRRALMRWHQIAAGLLVAALAMPAAAQEADPFSKIFDELRAHWSAAQKADAQSADACAAGPVPRMSFQPTTLYPDAIGVTASASGTVAIADQKQNHILVYAGGLDHEPIKLPLGGTYSAGAVQLSEDGRSRFWRVCAAVHHGSAGQQDRGHMAI